MSGITITYAEVVQDITLTDTEVTITFAETVANIGGGGSGANLAYTASATNGIVTSDTGTDATIPLGTGTNAGLLAPAQFTKLSNLSGTNTGDETAASVGVLINGSAAATPNDTDLVATAESSVLKKITWTNVKAFLKTYFDTLYQATGLAALKANNLSDLANAATARTNLGLGTLATQSGTFSGTSSGTNTGDQTSIVGITGTKAEFDTACTDGNFAYQSDISSYLAKSSVPCEFIVAASDLTTALAAGTGKAYFRAPYAFTLTAVRASLLTTQTSGSIFTVDINESGTSVLSTKLTIDNTEKTSTTAATAAVISDSAIADDAEITIDIDQIGDGTAKGLIITLIGTHSV